MKKSASLAAVLICCLGAGAIAYAGDPVTDPKQDPTADPDDPGPAPADPEPLPEKVEMPPRGSVDVESYVEDTPRAPDPLTAAKAGAPVGKAAAAGSVTICLNAHLQNIGWQGWRCAPAGAVDLVGTTGQSRRMEALAIVTYGAGGVCAQAHVQNIGWQGWACGSDGTVIAVGTTGRSLRMEAVGIGTVNTGTCANAHVATLGWLGWTCGPIGYVTFVGTTGQSRRMEALAVELY